MAERPEPTPAEARTALRRVYAHGADAAAELLGWEAKLAPVLAGEVRQRRHGKGGARSR